MNPPTATAAERLAQSRERLRLALNGLPPAPDDRQPARRVEQGLSPWWADLAKRPVAGLVIEAAQAWWARHPMRANIVLAFYATQTVVKPVAQRHPVALVAAAFVVGGVLGWRLPLRGLLRPALVSGLVPQLMLSLVTAQAQRRTTPLGKPNGQ